MDFSTNPLDKLDMPTPSASAIDRLRYLIRLSRLTQGEFAARINLDASNLSKIMSGKSPLTEGVINRVVANLGVSKEWLVSGTDVPFARPQHAVEVTDNGRRMGTGRRGAAVYDIDVTAGCMPLDRMFTQDRIIGFLDLPNINPESTIVRVSGDSMMPRIKDGAYVAIRPVSSMRNIAWGQIYVAVLEDYRFVKYVRRHPNPDYIILHSANPEYDDMDVLRSDVQALYLVELIFNYDILC